MHTSGRTVAASSIGVELLLLLAWASVASACQQSGFCSIGKVTPWSGDIITSAGLKAALQARSFRSEIIVSSTDKNSVEQSVHLYNDARALGFAHFLFIASFPECCAAMVKAMPDVGCAWDSTPNHPLGFDFEPLLWNWRWKFSARATRLGYNVLTLDLDVLLFNDPYVHFKQPPFANVTMFANTEMHYISPYPSCVMNGGFMYIQNAAPNGPVTWLFKEVVERPLRLLDDDLVTLKTWGKINSNTPRICLTYDQSWMADALNSALLHTPLHSWLIGACLNSTLHNHPAVHRISTLANRACSSLVSKHSAGADHRQVRHQPARNLWKHGTLRVPNATFAELFGDFPNGGMLFPPQRGNWSEHFRQQLRDDCPACPWWRDEPAVAAAGGGGDGGSSGAQDVEEIFTFVPQWLFSNYWTSGPNGYWSPSPTGEPPLQVMGHIHLMHGTPRGKGSKLGLSMLYHPPNDLDAFAKIHVSGTPYLTKRSVDRVLALSPAVDLAHTVHSVEELHRAMGGLLQLASLSDRIVAWPTLSCNASWMLLDRSNRAHHPARPDGLPLGLKNVFVPLVDRSEGSRNSSYSCFAASLLGSECSTNNALLPHEFRHWRDVQGAGGSATGGGTAGGTEGGGTIPSVRNTVLTSTSELAKQLARRRRWHDISSLFVISSKEAVAALERVRDEPVVYVGSALVVSGLEGDKAFENRARGCQALHKDWLQYAALYTHDLMPFTTERMLSVKLSGDNSTLMAASF